MTKQQRAIREELKRAVLTFLAFMPEPELALDEVMDEIDREVIAPMEEGGPSGAWLM
jgi:hypothetical protein